MFARIALFLWILSASLAADYYELLGVKRDATQKEIRRAFKALAVARHPDKNKDDPEAHRKFVEYTAAYEILKDQESRKKYDLYGEEGLDGANKQGNYRSWRYYRDNFGIYDDDPRVVALNENDYHDSVVDSEKMWIVNFYSPMCSHCRTLAPAWRRVAAELEGVVRVAAVNCEDDWRLCGRLGVRSYPTLLHYPANSKHGIRYTGERSSEAITRFVLDRLDVPIEKLATTEWRELREDAIDADERPRPTLVFARRADRHRFTSDERLKTAAIFDKIVDVRTYECLDDTCDGTFTDGPGAVFFLPSSKADRRSRQPPVLFDGATDTDAMIRQIFQLLPEPRDLDENEFEAARKALGEKGGGGGGGGAGGGAGGWLLYFYMGHGMELDFQLKRLPSVIRDIDLGKLNCGRYPKLCSRLNVNRYPMWGVLKPGGAFELSHGRDTINDIARFAENSVKAENVWALSSEEIVSIVERENGNEAWFVDWYAPWCPPCIQFLPELRKASLEFERSVVRFGTVDCTVHSAICRRYNIRSYPTAMLINGSATLEFTVEKTAANVAQFIREAINPTVVRLTSKNYDENIAKKSGALMWVVDYFAPWCGPCQRLAPEWTAVAKTFRHLPNVRIASVDCQTESALCGSQGVRSYPTIRLYPLGSEGLGKVAAYTGSSRDYISLSKWIAQFLPVRVSELSVDSLERDVLDSDDAWLVDYYAPWCHHCRTLEANFAIAAQLLEKKVRLGRFDCDAHEPRCSRAGIRAYPTLVIYAAKRAHRRRRKIDGGDRITSTDPAGMEQEVLEYLKVSAQSKRRDEL